MVVSANRAFFIFTVFQAGDAIRADWAWWDDEITGENERKEQEEAQRVQNVLAEYLNLPGGPQPRHLDEASKRNDCDSITALCTYFEEQRTDSRELREVVERCVVRKNQFGDGNERPEILLRQFLGDHAFRPYVWQIESSLLPQLQVEKDEYILQSNGLLPLQMDDIVTYIREGDTKFDVMTAICNRIESEGFDPSVLAQHYKTAWSLAPTSGLRSLLQSRIEDITECGDFWRTMAEFECNIEQDEPQNGIVLNFTKAAAESQDDVHTQLEESKEQVQRLQAENESLQGQLKALQEENEMFRRQLMTLKAAFAEALSFEK